MLSDCKKESHQEGFWTLVLRALGAEKYTYTKICTVLLSVVTVVFVLLSFICDVGWRTMLKVAKDNY